MRSNFLHSACLLPRQSCPSDGSLFTYLCSGDASGGSGIVNHPRLCRGGVGHRTPNPCLFSLPSGTHVRCHCAYPLESIVRVSPSRPGDTAITNGSKCNGRAVKPFPPASSVVNIVSHVVALHRRPHHRLPLTLPLPTLLVTHVVVCRHRRFRRF